MELYDVMRTTFSARQYTGDPLPDKILYDILDNARFAPSGGNRQGNRVIMVRNASIRQALAELAVPAAKRYAAQVAAGENPWNTIVPTEVTDAEVEATEPSKSMIETFTTASVVLVFIVDLNVVASMDKDLERIGVVSGASVYPFVWNVLLAARQAGFGGTITTQAVAEEDGVRELLNIPSQFAVAALVPLGKPVKQLTRLRRHPVSEIVSCERFDGEPFRLE
jgi:nitroreductase